MENDIETEEKVVQVKKRDGSIALFNKQKIVIAISKAMDAAGELDIGKAEEMSQEILQLVDKRIKRKIPDVEQIQDIVEEVIMKSGLVKVAKKYILYRHYRSELREAKRAVLHGFDDKMEFSLNALQILENRYLLRNSEGKITERPTDMFKRVATYVASLEKDPQMTQMMFEEILTKRYFLPTSPTLMNANNQIGQLISAYAIPIDDDITSIFDAVKYAALVHQSGGGTGFSFTRLRPKNDKVANNMAVSPGPLGFMRIFETSIDLIKQSGRRQGANMGVLRVDHPDIMEFINMKADGFSMPNFNLSVGITDAFMRAVKTGTKYSLVNPRTQKIVGSIPARVVFDNIVAMSWRKGEPGMLFLDRINKKHTCPHLGTIETTSPCGEMPLLPYESAAEGSINLVSMMDDDGVFNWDRLKKTVHIAVQFLDNVITLNKYPTKKMEETALQTRKIGLGVMGFADLLYQIGVPYNSEEGITWAKKIMKFIQQEAYKTSESLAYKRGVFPAWKGSKFHTENKRMRNASLTAIMPTGTMSLIADVSPGMEPNFALCYQRKALDGRELVYANQYFKRALKAEGLFSETLLRYITKRGTIQGMNELPKRIRDIFVMAQDIPATWHIKMQAAFQEFVDASISKTINFEPSATVHDVEEGLMAAWDSGCKGITIYRDGSMDAQIINLNRGGA